MTQNTPAEAGKAHDTHGTHGFRRKMVGRVISAKMKKTVVVEVVSHSRDALYGKYVRSRSRYKAHDELNTAAIGDLVALCPVSTALEAGRSWFLWFVHRVDQPAHVSRRVDNAGGAERACSPPEHIGPRIDKARAPPVSG